MVRQDTGSRKFRHLFLEITYLEFSNMDLFPIYSIVAVTMDVMKTFCIGFILCFLVNVIIAARIIIEKGKLYSIM